jgi:RNA polymerase sigma-70 factor (ECF subfamily)
MIFAIDDDLCVSAGNPSVNANILFRERVLAMISYMVFIVPDESDREWFHNFYIEHRKLMMVTAEYYLSSRQDADDVVSDSLVALFQKMDTLRSMDENALRYYIIRTVRNTAFNHMRKAKQTNLHFLHVSDSVKENMADNSSVEVLVLCRDDLDMVRDVVRDLPEKEREAVFLRFEDGLDSEEIARIMDVSTNSVYRYINRAREHIRKCAERRYVHES